MPQSLPRALLLDLDDTILSDSARVDECWMLGIRMHASHLGDVGMQRLMDEIVAAREWFWGDPARHRSGRLDLLETRRMIVREALQRIGHPDREMGTAVADTYSLHREKFLTVFPGAVETISQISKQGTKLALLTNGGAELQRAKITRFGLEPLFDCIIVEGEFGAGKPEEVVYRHALATLQTSPEDAWMVGDNLEWDVAGPQRIGVTGIWMDVRGNGLPADSRVRPDRIIRSLTELIG